MLATCKPRIMISGNMLRKARAIVILQYVIIIGLILLISWTVRYMVQRDMKSRQQGNAKNQDE